MPKYILFEKYLCGMCWFHSLNMGRGRANAAIKRSFSQILKYFTFLWEVQKVGSSFFLEQFYTNKHNFYQTQINNNYHSIQGAWNVCLQTTETMQM